MPVRIQRSRAPGWRMPAGAVYVGRPTLWGNPWKPGRPGRFWLPPYPIEDAVIGTGLDAGDAVDLYRRLLHAGPDPINRLLPNELSADGRRQVRGWLHDHASHIRAELHQIQGRDLACWCALDAPCHADVLLKLANPITCEAVT